MPSDDPRKRPCPARPDCDRIGFAYDDVRGVKSFCHRGRLTDLALAIHYGVLWFRVPASTRIEIAGKIPGGVYGKDIILHIIGKMTARGASYQSIEFGGSALGS